MTLCSIFSAYYAEKTLFSAQYWIKVFFSLLHYFFHSLRSCQKIVHSCSKKVFFALVKKTRLLVYYYSRGHHIEKNKNNTRKKINLSLLNSKSFLVSGPKHRKFWRLNFTRNRFFKNSKYLYVLNKKHFSLKT